MNGRTHVVQITTLIRIVLCLKGKSMLTTFQCRMIAGTMMKASLLRVDGVKTPFKEKFPNHLQMKLSGLMGGNETLILRGFFHLFFTLLCIGPLPAFVSLWQRWWIKCSLQVRIWQWYCKTERESLYTLLPSEYNDALLIETLHNISLLILMCLFTLAIYWMNREIYNIVRLEVNVFKKKNHHSK